MPFVARSVTDNTIQTRPPVLEFGLDMKHHLNPEKLSRLSAHLELLFSNVSGYGRDSLPPELADEIAATAGDIMVELADHRADELAGHVIEQARGLREVVRTLRPEPSRVSESGRALVSNIEAVIREDRRAA